jgi:4-amino-4-deoxy-L-arabinose transferase-like glycosyltransferase
LGFPAVAFGLLLIIAVPIRSAFLIGGDEGYELMKSVLSSKGYRLYLDIWNDQPPLHTLLLSGLFRVFGPSALVGRLLTVGFGIVLVSAFFHMVRWKSGKFAAWTATFILATSPQVVRLFTSVMLEVPALSLGLLSCYFLLQSWRNRQGVWLIASGIAMGCALQTKLTSGIFLPAIFAEFWAGGRSILFTPQAGMGHEYLSSAAAMKPGASPGRSIAPRPGVERLCQGLYWLAAAGGAFSLIACVAPGETPETLLRSHFSLRSVAGMDNYDEYAFSAGVFLGQMHVVLPAFAGALLLSEPRRRPCLFPLFLLGTVFAIHTLHRPYWPYYDLHFAIPLAWLGGIGLSAGFQVSRVQKDRFRFHLLAWSAAASFAFIAGAQQFLADLKSVRNSDRVSDVALVGQIRAGSPANSWIFIDDVIYAFHAGLCVPPELAVIPKKRIWNGQLTSADMSRNLQKYAPENVIFTGRIGIDGRKVEYLNRNYAVTTNGFVHWYRGISIK